MSNGSDLGRVIASAAIGGGVATAVSLMMRNSPAAAAPDTEKLSYLIDLQTATLEQLQRLVQLQEQLIGNIPIIQPVLAQQQISVPLSPQVLHQIIASNRDELTGKVGVMHYQYAILCPAGITTFFANTTPLGWVGVHVGGANVEFSLYDENIEFSLFIIDEEVSHGTPCASNIVLSSDLYRPIHEGGQIIMEIENNTLLDTVAYPEFMVLYLEKSYYEDFYLPIIRKAYEAYRGIAEAV